jgi:hypothetical protein
MDALELLKTDHKKVKELSKKAEANENKKQQKQLLSRSRRMLKMEL